MRRGRRTGSRVPRCRAAASRDAGGAFAITVCKPLVQRPVLYSQIPLPTEYPDGFTTFTPSIAATPCPYTSVTGPSTAGDALTAAGVDTTRIYSNKLSGTSTRKQRPGLAALLNYAREGDAIVVVRIDR